MSFSSARAMSFKSSNCTPAMSYGSPSRAQRVVTGDRRTELPVRDISQGGIFLFTPGQLFPLGEHLLLEIGAPEGSPEVLLTAEVVRTVAGETGCVLGVGM